MNNPFNFFDKIYCINLKERTDRWEQCLKNFEKLEITNYERIDAIKVNGDIHPKRKGQIGCALSFCKTFEKALNDNHQQVLIFEDDFEFNMSNEQLFSELKSSISELPEQWDSFYLGCTLIDCYGRFPIEKYSKNLFKIKSAHALHSTAFSKNGLLKIKNFFSNKDNWYIDLVNNYENMDVFIAKEFLKTSSSYMTKDLLCFQRSNYSNIENNYYDYNQLMKDNFNFFKNKLT